MIKADTPCLPNPPNTTSLVVRPLDRALVLGIGNCTDCRLVGANLVVDTLKFKLLVGWLTATTSSIVGLYASYKLDLPTGAAIVCALGGALLLVAGAARFRGNV